MQSRIMEHLDRLKTYAEVREKVVARCQSAGGGDDPDCGQLETPEWQEGIWQEEEWEDPDVQALANNVCYNCGGSGHLARAGPGKGGGKGGKGANGGKGEKVINHLGSANNVGETGTLQKGVGNSTPN